MRVCVFICIGVLVWVCLHECVCVHVRVHDVCTLISVNLCALAFRLVYGCWWCVGRVEGGCWRADGVDGVSRREGEECDAMYGCLSVCMCVGVCVCICLFVCMYVYALVQMCSCVCMCTCVYVR